MYGDAPSVNSEYGTHQRFHMLWNVSPPVPGTTCVIPPSSGQKKTSDTSRNASATSAYSLASFLLIVSTGKP